MKFCTLLPGAALLALTSCASAQAPNRLMIRRKPPVFRKLPHCSLELTLLSSRREFYAGEEHAAVTFGLKNTGVRPVIIDEWHAQEEANLKLYYRPGASADASGSGWILAPTCNPKTRSRQLRAPLALNPWSNQALIRAPLTFLKNLPRPAGGKTPYMLRAELNLNSVSAVSRPEKIYVK